MSKKKKKAKLQLPANNIVSFNRDDVEHISKEDMYGFADYTIARNAARMLLSEGICSHLFVQAMHDEMEAQGMEAV